MSNRLFNSSARKTVLAISGWFSCIFGFIVLLGWAFKIPALIMFFLPAPTSMANTAICFLFSGISILSIYFSRMRLSLLATAIVLCVSALTGIEYIFEVNLGIDQLLFPYFLPEKMIFPGRPSYVTTLSFFFIGISLILSTFRYRHTNSIIIELLCATVAVLGALSLFRYIAGLFDALNWADVNSVSLHTAIGLIIVSLSIFHYNASPAADKNTLFLAPAIGLCAFLVTLAIVFLQIADAQQEIGLQNLAKTNADYIANETSLLLQDRITAFNRLARRFELLNQTPDTLWDKDTSNYIHDFESLSSITWYNPNFTIKNRSIHIDAKTSDFHEDEIEEMIKNLSQKELQKIFIYRLFGDDLIFCFPMINPDRTYKGFLVITMDFPTFAKTSFPKSLFHYYNIRISNENKIFYEKSLPYSKEIGKPATSDIAFSFLQWTVTISATNYTYPLIQSFSVTTLLSIFGFIAITILLVFLVFSLQSIAKAKQNLSFALEEKAEALAFRQAVLDAANYSIISTDPSGIIRSFNHTAENLLLWKKEDVIGKTSPLIFHDPEEMAKRAKELSEELHTEVQPSLEVFITMPKQGKADERTWTYIRKDGSRFPVSLSVTSVKDAQGHILGFLGIASDLTKITQLELDKQTLMSITSHELRSPISAIKNTFELLYSRENISEEGKSLIEVSKRSCDRLVRLTSDILDIQKIESGKIEFNFQKISLRDVLFRAFEENKILVESNKIHLSEPKDIPECTLSADFDRLIQVLTNFISNAIKHAPENSTISFVVTKNNQKIRVGIKDEGPGLPEEFKSRIFQKFSQSKLESRDPKQGTGLGLYISKVIIESHKGTIGVDSSENGSLFWFELEISS